ncbi:MAG: PSD1 and planctomycete cytochrome C domain-containing protein [Pirellulales bacterium]|nr:PSD1 and planctomycete cytochrome C domain-containing protein [Pirellulales bacterium]
MFTVISAFTASAVAEDKVRFNRDVRPILSNNCFECHGFDAKARAAELRLDTREGATAELESGEGSAVVPGKPAESVLLARITSHDVDEKMPPADSGKKLTAVQIETLKKWIAQGANYESHWSFVPPESSAPPKVSKSAWPRNLIDHFILARLESDGLTASPEADRRTLIRRVALDVTGLPPTRVEIAQYVEDKSPDAYEKMVDRYLASPRYGEHMARYWLDLARYADSNGYQYDTERTMWVWRDWVIHAYNSNMPFDQFTIEQLAGDLLPNATPHQVLATGFNRNHPITIEGGIIDEEYRTEYVLDRLVTTSTVWMGLTMGCARCHDHKFDPVSQKEFYQLSAFFNQVPERGMRGFTPNQTIASPLADPKAKVKYPATMVMRDSPKPRTTHFLILGQYDRKGEVVSPGVPASLVPMADDAPQNRLGFARWLMNEKHPLTARVAVNRYWQRLFGTGLVKTLEDFGFQGEWPSHPALLDALAVRFSKDWDVKAIQRLMLTSATYRQSARVSKELYERDPENRLLARGPRFRLDAEQIRDQALAVSGLLVEKIGGPSVYPYQPKGLWLELNNRPGYSKAYKPGTGESLYRRSMYTFWKRTVLSPMLKTFDAPGREFCTVARSRTNTPLQALLLLQGPQFVEAARHLAQRMMKEGGTDVESRIAFGFELVTGRVPTSREAELLTNAYRGRLAFFKNNNDAAKTMVSVGASPRDTKLDIAEHAAWTEIARLLLNLDETVTRG